MYLILKTPLADTVSIDTAGIVHLKFNVGLCFESKNGNVEAVECGVTK
jgi:hypothetical protein